MHKISYNSWDQQVFFFSPDHRNPAAIKKSFDFSHLEGSKLVSHSQERLIAAAKILMNEESVGIELGHFVAKNSEGKKQSACRAYNQVELVFKAGDMLVHGSPPEMVIKGPCLYQNNSDRISAIWIPMADILKSKVGNTALDFGEAGEVGVRFSNIGDEWPRVWGLASVRLSNSDSLESELMIDESRMNDILEKPLTFFWAQDFDKDLDSHSY